MQTTMKKLIYIFLAAYVMKTNGVIVNILPTVKIESSVRDLNIFLAILEVLKHIAYKPSSWDEWDERSTIIHYKNALLAAIDVLESIAIVNKDEDGAEKLTKQEFLKITQKLKYDLKNDDKEPEKKNLRTMAVSFLVSDIVENINNRINNKEVFAKTIEKVKNLIRNDDSEEWEQFYIPEGDIGTFLVLFDMVKELVEAIEGETKMNLWSAAYESLLAHI